MSLFGSFQGSRSHSLPTENNGFFGKKRTVCQLIPANHFATFFTQIITDTFHKVTLQIFFICQMLLFHPFLAKRAFLPIRLSRFISSDVNIAGRKKCQNFVEYILQECKYAVVSRAIDYFGIPSSQSGKHTDKVFHNRAGKLGVGSQSGVTVCGYIYFGNYFNLPVGGISHYLPNLILRVETAYRSRFPTLRVTA